MALQGMKDHVPLGKHKKTSPRANIGACVSVVVVSDICDNTDVIDLPGKFGNESYPAWRPNSNQIAFVGGGGEYVNESGVYLMNSDGTNIIPIITESQIPDFDPANHFIELPSWSADGSQLIFEIHKISM